MGKTSKESLRQKGRMQVHIFWGEKVHLEVQNQLKLEEAGYKGKKSVSIGHKKSYTCKTSEKIKPWYHKWLFLDLCVSVWSNV